MSRENDSKVETKKVVAIYALMLLSVAIVAFGAVMTVSSIVNNINFNLLNSKIHGAFLGLIVMFLGVRYFVSVFKLKKEVYKASAHFSWSNFKKAKAQKN